VKRRLSLILILLAPLWSTQSAAAAAGPTPSSTMNLPLVQVAALTTAYWVGTLAVHAHANGTDEYGGTTVVDYQVSATAHTDGTVAYSGTHFQENVLSNHLCRVTSNIRGAGTSRLPLTASLQYNLPTGGQGWFIRGTYSGRAEDPPSENFGMRGTKTYQGCGAGNDGVFSYESNQPPYVVAAGPASATHLEGSWTDTSIPSWVVNYSYNLTLFEPDLACEDPASASVARGRAAVGSHAAPVPPVHGPSVDERTSSAAPKPVKHLPSKPELTRRNAELLTQLSAGMAVGSLGCILTGQGGAGLALGGVAAVLALWGQWLYYKAGPAPAGAQSQVVRAARAQHASIGPRALSYTTIAEPIPRRLSSQPLTAGGDVTQAVADAGNALLTAVQQILALDEAIITALVRADEAQAAGDSAWEMRQMAAAQRYTADEGPVLKRMPGLLAAFQSALDVARFHHRPAAAEVADFQAYLRTTGLPPELSRSLAELGATSEDQEEIRQSYLATDLATVVTGVKLTEALGAPGLVSAFDDQVAIGETFARPQPNVGVRTAPAEIRGQLTTTITARDALCTPNNQLQNIRFSRLDNATVDVPGVGTITSVSGAPIPLVGGPPSMTLTLRRIRDGQASTVALVVTDGCGEWPTFFGGGPNAF